LSEKLVHEKEWMLSHHQHKGLCMKGEIAPGILLTPKDLDPIPTLQTATNLNPKYIGILYPRII